MKDAKTLRNPPGLARDLDTASSLAASTRTFIATRLSGRVALDRRAANRDNARMILSLIAALDRNFAIGRDGVMPWHLPDDLKRFKQLTLGKPILMGRKTALAVGKALPGRRNLVLTRGTDVPFAGQEAIASIAAAIEAARGDELCVIGGGEVYALALPYATDLNLTWVDTAAERADAFFPRFDPSEWVETQRVPHAADARHEYSFSFVDYVRRRR